MSVTDDDDPESQAVKRKTLLNDARVLEQSRNGDTGTFLSHALGHADELSHGRFKAMGAPNVIGSTPTPDYPAGPAWSADPGSQLIEPPLGYRIDAMPGDSSTVHPAVEKLGEPISGGDAPSLATSSGDVQRTDVGSPPSQEDRENG